MTDQQQGEPGWGRDQLSEAAESGLSLDELSKAYAQLINTGEEPYPVDDPPDAEVETETEADEEDADVDEEEADEQEIELTPLAILEAIMFVGHPANEVLSGASIAALMRGVRQEEIPELVEELNAEYQETENVFHVVSSGAGYRMVLRDEFANVRDAFYGRVREARLSQPAIDILAVVAYQQGLRRDEIDELRGKPSGAILSQLVRRQLLRIERPEDKPRRPQYFTTDRFLTLFGLESLDDLPQSQD